MSGNTNNKSDLGFIIFLVLAIVILIPLGIGFDNFESLFRTIKIILGIAFGIIIASFVIIGYFFFKRKYRRKNISKNKDNQKINSETISTTLESEIDNNKIEIINENPDIINQKQTQRDTDNLSIKLKTLNKEFDL